GRGDLGLADGARRLDVHDDAGLHINQIIVRIGKECRSAHGPRPLRRGIGRRYELELLFDDRDVVAAGPPNPMVRRPRIELAKLMNEPWVLPPPDNLVGSVAMTALRACGLDYPRTTVFTDSPHVRMSLLATGRFLSIFPLSALRFSAQRPQVRVL